MGRARAVHYASFIGLTAFGLVPANGQGVVVSGVRTDMLVQECARHYGNNLDPCAAYLMGALDQLSRSRRLCPPRGYTIHQSVVAFQNYTASHPGQWTEHPTWLVERALSATYPCTKK